MADIDELRALRARLAAELEALERGDGVGGEEAQERQREFLRHRLFVLDSDLRRSEREG